MAFVMPFLQSLGYNVFDPNEVVPEFTADVGIKKGEKVDYAIKQDDQVIMLIECKSVGTKLSVAHVSQLMRYFSVLPKVRLAILTNGQVYQFYTDSQDTNLMDQAPFMELDLLNINEHVLTTLLPRLVKGQFDPDEVIDTATTLRETNAIKDIFIQQLQEPDDDFIKYFASQIHNGPVTQKVRERFGPLIQTALQQYIKTRISARLNAALEQEEIDHLSAAPSEAAEVPDDGIETTQEEVDAFNIVRAIARQVVDIERIALRDAKSYCNVLLDDNNRKPIVRLHFNGANLYISYFKIVDGQRVEEKVAIETVDDIYNYTDAIKEGIQSYDEPEEADGSDESE